MSENPFKVGQAVLVHPDAVTQFKKSFRVQDGTDDTTSGVRTYQYQPKPWTGVIVAIGKLGYVCAVEEGSPWPTVGWAKWILDACREAGLPETQPVRFAYFSDNMSLPFGFDPAIPESSESQEVVDLLELPASPVGKVAPDFTPLILDLPPKYNALLDMLHRYERASPKVLVLSEETVQDALDSEKKS